jgi:hypothetical protein
MCTSEFYVIFAVHKNVKEVTEHLLQLLHLSALESSLMDMQVRIAASASAPPPCVPRVRRYASAFPPPSGCRTEDEGTFTDAAPHHAWGADGAAGRGGEPRISSREAGKVPCAISRKLSRKARDRPGRSTRQNP